MSRRTWLGFAIIALPYLGWVEAIAEPAGPDLVVAEVSINYDHIYASLELEPEPTIVFGDERAGIGETFANGRLRFRETEDLPARVRDDFTGRDADFVVWLDDLWTGISIEMTNGFCFLESDCVLFADAGDGRGASWVTIGQPFRLPDDEDRVYRCFVEEGGTIGLELLGDVPEKWTLRNEPRVSPVSTFSAETMLRFHTAEISDLSLEDVSFGEAIRAIREQWVAQFPNAWMPLESVVENIVVEQIEPSESMNARRIDEHFDGISFHDAIEQCCVLGGVRFFCRDVGVYGFRFMTWVGSDDFTRVWTLTPELAEQLDLIGLPVAEGDQRSPFSDALRGHGFRPVSAYYNSAKSLLIMKAEPIDQRRIAGMAKLSEYSHPQSRPEGTASLPLPDLVVSGEDASLPTPALGTVVRMREATIPHLHLEDSDFVEAFALITQSWAKEFPDPSFPFAAEDFGDRGSDRKISLDLYDMPYHDALHYMISLYSRSAGMIAINKNVWQDGRLQKVWPGDMRQIDSYRCTEVFEMSEETMAFFGLTPTTTAAELLKALEKFGFSPSAAFIDGIDPTVLAMTAPRDEITAFHGIAILLGEGYVVEEPKGSE